MCLYRDAWVISQNASAALKYMSGVGAAAGSRGASVQGREIGIV